LSEPGALSPPKHSTLCLTERGVWHVRSLHGADHFAVASHRLMVDASASRRFWDAYVLLLRGLDARN
jgi:hypothetical protein